MRERTGPGGPRHRRRIGLRHIAAAAAAVALLAGCGGSSATVAVPSLSPDALRTCRALHAALPSTVAGAQRRTTDPASDATAAWGDPAVTLTCGVGLPAPLDPLSPQYDPESNVVTVNGVDWLVQNFTRGFRLTATGRAVYVQVDVPDAYQDRIDGVLVALSTPVAAADPVTGAAPSAAPAAPTPPGTGTASVTATGA